MAGKSCQQWVGSGKDKENDRDVDQHGTNNDDVVQIGTDKTNNPFWGR